MKNRTNQVVISLSFFNKHVHSSNYNSSSSSSGSGSSTVAYFLKNFSKFYTSQITPVPFIYLSINTAFSIVHPFCLLLTVRRTRVKTNNWISITSSGLVSEFISVSKCSVKSQVFRLFIFFREIE